MLYITPDLAFDHTSFVYDFSVCIYKRNVTLTVKLNEWKGFFFPFLIFT